MIKRKGLLNRKGDVTITTVILIILGIVVLVMLVVGLTKGFDFLFGNIDTVDPGKLQVLASACQGYAQGGLKISYCQFKEVDTLNGVKQFYNCDTKIIEDQMSGVAPLDCDDADADKTFCDSKTGDKTKIKVFYKDRSSTCNQLAVSGTCSGATPKACSEYTTPTGAGTGSAACQAAGCTWTASTNACGGNPKACNQIIAQDICANAGCTWIPTPSA